MVIYNAATRELTAKIVYYGPGLCGKTTNLKVLHDRLEPGTAGRLLNLQTQTDRTIYFDLLPVELGDIKGYKIRFQLATVPGQTAFNETRRVVLKGVDGIVFVADSQWTMLPKNLESWQNLKDNLKSNEITFEKIPVVVQYNKRDLADILAVDAMQEALGLSSYPFVEAVASAGRGVTETFKLISKLTFVDLLRRLQGRRAEDADAVAPSPAPAPSKHDDLQTWKDSLLNRESQAVPASPERPSRPFVLVPRVSDEAPFDTTELGRGVDEEEGPSPFSVPEPPDLSHGAPPEAPSPAETMQMEAVAHEHEHEDVEEAEEAEEIEEVAEEPETLDASEEVEIEILASVESHTDPAFLPPEAKTSDGRLQLLEQRLLAAEERANREREASERLSQTLTAVQERLAESGNGLSALAERLAAIEQGVGGLHENLGSALQRLAPMEGAAGRHADLEASLRGMEAGLRDLDERLRSDSNRQRKDSDDVGMALRNLTERAQIVDQQIAAMVDNVGGHQSALAALSGLAEHVPQMEGQLSELRELAGKLPQLESQIEAVLRQHHDIEAALDEKTQQGRREAEDIRSQIAPLLEERVRRHESDAALFSEMDRLRESLADSLHDLAERLRHAVRDN